jgi:uncharacterized protein
MQDIQSISTRPFTIINTYGDPIRGDLHLPQHTAHAPVLVICHGFKGFKDWGSFPAIADAFARAGWLAVRFNFSLNGIGEDGMTFTRLDDFGRNTLSRELDDLGDVLDAVEARAIVPADADTSRIALLGHSRGGGVAILKAAEDARVTALVAWASVATFDRWGEETKRLWRERGLLEVMNVRTNQKMPLGVALLEDYEKNEPRLNVLPAMARIRVPILIVHGDQDLAVPVEEARQLYGAADRSLAELAIIPNADHAFGAAHPFQGIGPALATVLERTTLWLETHGKNALRNAEGDC